MLRRSVKPGRALCRPALVSGFSFEVWVYISFNSFSWNADFPR